MNYYYVKQGKVLCKQVPLRCVFIKEFKITKYYLVVFDAYH